MVSVRIGTGTMHNTRLQMLMLRRRTPVSAEDPRTSTPSRSKVRRAIDCVLAMALVAGVPVFALRVVECAGLAIERAFSRHTSVILLPVPDSEELALKVESYDNSTDPVLGYSMTSIALVRLSPNGGTPVGRPRLLLWAAFPQQPDLCGCNGEPPFVTISRTDDSVQLHLAAGTRIYARRCRNLDGVRFRCVRKPGR